MELPRHLVRKSLYSVLPVREHLAECRENSPVSRRELAGRRAGVGYSAVVIGSTKAEGPPHACEAAKTASAKPAQFVAPALVIWKMPRQSAPSGASIIVRATARMPSAMSGA